MIDDNISKIRQRVASACKKVNRHPEEITVVAVTKNRTKEDVLGVLEAGITDIGENKVQDAVSRYRELGTFGSLQRVRWHMVGHLQTNKVKEAVRIFDLIHSVDSFHLALEIDKRAREIDKVQDILIEVNTSHEATKFGIRPQELEGLLTSLKSLKNIRTLGLMTIAPLSENKNDARLCFKSLRDLRRLVNDNLQKDFRLNVLSMGMSDDFETAIEEGSDVIRIGRAIFEGEKNK